MIAICDKVLFDQATNLPSLISIFTRVDVQINSVALPENAVSPTRWVIFTKWDCTPEQRNVEYLQKTEIRTPDGTVFASVETPFSVKDTNDLSSKNALEMFGIPVSIPGMISVRTWIEGVEDARGECSLYVNHTQPAASQ